MSRTVHCIKYGKRLPGLDEAPFPGEKGKLVFEQVSAQAWDAWLAQQTMLINEHRLNPLDKTTKLFLAEERNKFFANKSQKPQGYREE